MYRVALARIYYARLVLSAIRENLRGVKQTCSRVDFVRELECSQPGSAVSARSNTSNASPYSPFRNKGSKSILALRYFRGPTVRGDQRGLFSGPQIYSSNDMVSVSSTCSLSRRARQTVFSFRTQDVGIMSWTRS